MNKDIIIELLRRMKQSKTKIAKEVGVNESKVTDWINRRDIPTQDELKNIIAFSKQTEANTMLYLANQTNNKIKFTKHIIFFAFWIVLSILLTYSLPYNIILGFVAFLFGVIVTYSIVFNSKVNVSTEYVIFKSNDNRKWKKLSYNEIDYVEFVYKNILRTSVFDISPDIILAIFSTSDGQMYEVNISELSKARLQGLLFYFIAKGKQIKISNKFYEALLLDVNMFEYMK